MKLLTLPLGTDVTLYISDGFTYRGKLLSKHYKDHGTISNGPLEFIKVGVYGIGKPQVGAVIGDSMREMTFKVESIVRMSAVFPDEIEVTPE